MGDLVFGCGLVAFVATGVFLSTCLVVRRLSLRTCNLLGVLVVTAMVYYVAEFWYDARLARWLPFSNLIVVGNWMPLGAAVLAALVWRHTQIPAWRRALPMGFLAATAAYGLVFPLLGRAPVCKDKWDFNGVCNQTTEFTCSPAAAATLLRMHGIAANEQEMAELCLTREGTSWPGLYRGLKLKTAGTKWDVDVLSCSASELSARNDGPMILSVGLERGARVDANFSRETGWIAGVNHSVVLLDFKRGAAEVVDPSQPYCRERWDAETMRILWRGLAIRLVERK